LPDARGPILAVGDDSGRDYATLLRALEGLSTRTLIRTGLPLDLNERHGGVAVLRDRLTPLAFRQLYAGSRFVVVPLRLDTRNASGISTIMEAAAMGKAVIASDSDGIRGAVRHEETGLVVPANDPTALRTAIERLLREPATCDRLGQEARRRIERTAAPAVFAGRLAAAFRALGRH
jgi:glycosyltransferase involved in cell wall biosynthesis